MKKIECSTLVPGVGVATTNSASRNFADRRYWRGPGLNISHRVRDLKKAPLVSYDSGPFQDYKFGQYFLGSRHERPIYEVVGTNIHS